MTELDTAKEVAAGCINRLENIHALVRKVTPSHRPQLADQAAIAALQLGLALANRLDELQESLDRIERSAR